MPDETRNYVPKLQAVKNIVADPGEVRSRPRRHPGRAVLRGRQDDAQDGRQARRRAGRDAGRRIPVPQPAPQSPGHRRCRRAHDPAAHRPRGTLRRQARTLRPAAGVLAGASGAQGRDGAAGRGQVRDIDRDAACSQWCRGAGAASARVTCCWCPRSAPSAESEATLGQAVFTTVPQGRTFYYRVRRGDTLPAIATRYAVTAQEIRGWNASSDQRHGRAAAAHHQRSRAQRQQGQARDGQARPRDAGQGCRPRRQARRPERRRRRDARARRKPLTTGTLKTWRADPAELSRAAGRVAARRPPNENRRRVQRRLFFVRLSYVADFRSRRGLLLGGLLLGERPSCGLLGAAFFAAFLTAFLAAFLRRPSSRPS